MIEKKDTTPEENIKQMFSNMGNYMVTKLKTRIESIKKRIEDVKKSDKKNKEEIVSKLKELIEVMDKILEKTELQTKTQKELFELMESISKLDTDIDNLLLKDGN